MDRPSNIPDADERPLSRLQTARLFMGSGLTLPQLIICTQQVEGAYPDLIEHVDGVPYFGRDAISKIETLTPPQEGWCDISTLALQLSCDPQTVRSATRKLISSDDQYKEECVKRTALGETEPSLFLSPLIIEKVAESVTERLAQQRLAADESIARKSFSTFVELLRDEESIEAQEFKALVELFGPESGVDLIFQYRPEYSRVPVDMVKSFLSDYIGSITIKKGYLNFDNLPKTVEFLNNETLRNCLVEVIKNHCLSHYLLTYRDNSSKDDLSIISSHLDFLREKIRGINDERLNDVLEQVEEYYTWLFVDIEKPESFISNISGDRPFPDLGQRINVGEVVKKRRVLLADEPGMGKSASAIMAKEVVESKCAVIVSPPSMIDTWLTYLSDQTDDQGVQIGYFKKGKAPKVLVVDSLQALDIANDTSYDYVLLSHNRLTADYVDKLQQFGFDMLITDEAHELKNLQEGVRASQLIRLADYIESQHGHSVLLTATPAPNKVSDIAMTLRLLYPSQFKDLTNAELALRIINGDYIDLRTLLVPRMQRKQITQTVDMPPLVEREIPLALSKEMSEVYELLLEDDEMTSTEKIQRIRQFLSNPASLEATPDVESAKAIALVNDLTEHFKKEDKILMFVNDFMTNIVRGERTIFEFMSLPKDISVVALTGDSSQSERDEARRRFQHNEDKQLLVVSGSIAGVGLDFSAADRVIFYNEPWNKSIKRQQIGRAYRPGRRPGSALQVDSYYFESSLEEGMIRYSEAKERAIEKLLTGIDLTELEKTALRFEEEQKREHAEANLNHELAAYYYSSWQRMLRMFGHVKEIGTEEFQKSFLPPYGKEYADTYKELMYRSYQANAARLSGSLLAEAIGDRKQDPRLLRVLDIASGPEMLAHHVTDDIANSIISLDMNPRHFDERKGVAVVGSMHTLPVASGSIDYANMSLALHYTRQHMRDGVHERAESLIELNRVLRSGGRAFLTMIYSYQFEDMDKTAEALEKIGFRIVRKSSGEVVSGKNFSAQLLTLEKVRNAPSFSSLTVKELQELSTGLKLKKKDSHLRDTRLVSRDYMIREKRTLQARMNQSDTAVLDEETALLADMSELRKKYGTIVEIPPHEITIRGYSRLIIGNRPILFSRLKSAIGSVILR